jgi:hypothetical protein
MNTNETQAIQFSLGEPLALPTLAQSCRFKQAHLDQESQTTEQTEYMESGCFSVYSVSSVV